jgi:murein DD-endopeptidase MepM/ murein hydrolase activator NlpD
MMMRTDDKEYQPTKASIIGLRFLSDMVAPIAVAFLSTFVIASSELSQAWAQQPSAISSNVRSDVRTVVPQSGSFARTSASTQLGSPSITNALQRTPAVTAQTGNIALVNNHGQPISPGAVVVVGNDIYFLDPTTLWLAPNAVPSLSRARQLVLTSYGPAKPVIGNTPMQEFSNMAYSPDKHAIEVLDKSGDLFEFDTQTKAWRVLRPNSPLGSPDPEYIDMAVCGKNVLLLDPERNQIWRYPATHARYFREIMPWRLRAGDISVADGIAIAYDGDTWVLHKSGAIAKFNAGVESGMGKQLPFHWQPPLNFRPSRMYTKPGLPLFIVERENNRILTVDKKTSAVQVYLMPATTDLRGIAPALDGFCAIDGASLHIHPLSQPDNLHARPNSRQIDDRLLGLTLPIPNSALPRHAGVWPGARRLYRYGIHKGTDFFSDAGPIIYGTRVFAADGGKVIRSDGGFRDMDAPKYSRVMYECHNMHITTEQNEDLLRGCQVWIDHGNGLITKYAHLDRINPALKPGMRISRGELVGYVGVSGTGENLPGRAKHPHLHFEVWLNGRYLGYGLTPAETIGVYEDIFGTTARNRTGRGVRKA